MLFNILSGDEMAQYADTLQIKGNIICFSESLISGPVKGQPFSDKFISERSAFHQVHPDKYRKKFAQSFIKLRQGDEIHLWFGEDLFCQLNLICVLAHLEKIGIADAVFHVVFEDEMKQTALLNISSKGFLEVYNNVFINKTVVPTGIEITDKALTLYTDLLDDNGVLATFVKQNPDDSILSLTVKIIRSYASYGLGEVQCKEFIERIRSLEQAVQE